MLRDRTIALWIALVLVSPSASWAQQAAKPLPTVAPAEAGLDPAVLGQINAKMKAAVEKNLTSGVVTLVAKDGKIVLHEAVGYADLASKTPMAKDSMFGIASMTKPIATTALMIMVDEKKVGLDDPVSKYIPEFKDVALKDGTKPKQPILVRHVVTHTNGIGGYQQNMGSLEQTAKELAKRPLEFEPGTKWLYGPGISVAGRIVEVASGKPFDDFLAERILRPLGMGDTTFRLSPEQQKRLAKLYQPTKDKQGLEIADSWILKEPTPNPSGGLFSTAGDLSRFYQMILNGGEYDGKRIVSKQAIAEMTKLQTGDIATGFTPGSAWGLGFSLVVKPQGVSQSLSPGSFGHGGAFGTQAWLDPTRQMFFVLLVQRTGFGNSDGSDLRGTLQDLAVQAIKKGGQ